MSDTDKIVKFRDLAAIEEEAAGWVARLDGDALSAEDHAAYSEWRSRSAHHREAFDRLSRLWVDLDGLRELAAPIDGRLDRQPGSSRLASFGEARGIALRVAVLLVMIATAAGAAVGLFGIGGSDGKQFFQTAVGVQKTVSLPDGSSIFLNTDSALEVSYSRDRRNVRLTRGEAFFDVAPDRSRPFSVFAGDDAVRAVGTAFAVRLSDRNVEVTVTKGTVALAAIPAAQEAATPAASSRRELGLVTAGQDAVFHDAVERLASIDDTELSRKLAWRHGVIAFNGERLPEVVADISRYTKVKIEIKDRRLNDLRVGGYFRVGQVDAMFEALEGNFGVRVVRVNDNLVQLFAGS